MKILFKTTCILGSISLLLLLVCCAPNQRTINKFLEESRDPRLVGRWEQYSNNRHKFIVIHFKSNGELINEFFEEDHPDRTWYYYTRDDSVLHILMPGEGIKVSDRHNTDPYHISDDGSELTYFGEAWTKAK